MWRYYAAATVIVIIIGGIVFAHRITTGEWTLRAQPTGTPTITRAEGNDGGANAGFVGDGPWVLSALPDCFDQQSSLVGTTLQLTFDVPPASRRIAPGTVLRRGPCRVLVRPDDLVIVRGGDRLRVPPDARLYATSKGLTLVYRHAGHAEIRVYASPPR